MYKQERMIYILSWYKLKLYCGFISSLLAHIIIAILRSENEIEYKYDFSNLVRRVYINTSNTNLVPRASFSTGQQFNREERGLWTRDWFEIRSQSRTRTR